MQRLIVCLCVSVCACVCVCLFKSVCQVVLPFFAPVYLQYDKLAINFASLQHAAATALLDNVLHPSIFRGHSLWCAKDSTVTDRRILCLCPRCIYRAEVLWTTAKKWTVHRFQFNIFLLQLPLPLPLSLLLLPRPLLQLPPFLFLCLFLRPHFSRLFIAHVFIEFFVRRGLCRQMRYKYLCCIILPAPALTPLNSATVPLPSFRPTAFLNWFLSYPIVSQNFDPSRMKHLSFLLHRGVFWGMYS